MKNLIILIFTSILFTLLIACASLEVNNEKEYNLNVKRNLDSFVITYKLDSTYKETDIGNDWCIDCIMDYVKKYKKNNEILIRFYPLTEKDLHDINEEVESSLKVIAEHEGNRHYIKEDPFLTIEQSLTNFSNQKGYINKFKRKIRNDFLLSYCTINDSCKTGVTCTMKGQNLKIEDELVFKSLIKSFSFQKK